MKMKDMMFIKAWELLWDVWHTVCWKCWITIYSKHPCVGWV